MNSLSRFFRIVAVLFLVAAVPVLMTQRSWAIENSDCLECHGDESFTKEGPNGKEVSLYVDEAKFAASVHGQNDVACVDCHSDIEKLNEDEDVPHPVPLKPVDCSQCHEDEQEAYANSVHAEVAEEGDPDSPTCAGCHGNHYIQSPQHLMVKEREEAFCKRCHKPEEYHKWLPNKEAHFNTVECSVCHAPKNGSKVNLILYDFYPGKCVTPGEVQSAVGMPCDDFLKHMDKNGNGKIDVSEFRTMVDVFKKKGLQDSFKAEVAADMEPSVHGIVSSDEAVRSCKACHSINSKVLSNVSIMFLPKKGDIPSYPADRQVLIPFYTDHFYVLNGTVHRIFDIIGLLIVLGGVAFAGGHGTIRLLTAPMRRKRKEEKEEEEDK